MGSMYLVCGYGVICKQPCQALPLIPRPSGTPFERGKARDDGRELDRAVKKGSDNNGRRVRERQRPTGLGAPGL